MKVIDSHTHLDTLTWSNLAQMRLAGIQAIVSPIHLDTAKPVACQTIIDVWDYLLEVQLGRAKANGIKAHAMIGISMVSTPANDPQTLFSTLPNYLRKEEVVAIGEIGFEPNSRTCSDIAEQATLIRKQLEIAAAENICVNFHVPNAPDQKKEFTAKTLEICSECKFPMHKVIIDHCSEANLGMVLEAGAHATITVQPWRNMTPALAADLVLKFGPERIMVDSDCGGGISDPLAVPKTAVQLMDKGVGESQTEAILYGNAIKAYALPE